VLDGSWLFVGLALHRLVGSARVEVVVVPIRTAAAGVDELARWVVDWKQTTLRGQALEWEQS
jgi:hypothetical protein